MRRPPPRAPLFPYTTLFRSRRPDGSTVRWESRAHRKRSRETPTAARGADQEPVWWRPRQQRWWMAVLFALGSLCFAVGRSEEHTSELQSQFHLVCRLLLEKK